MTGYWCVLMPYAAIQSVLTDGAAIRHSYEILTGRRPVTQVNLKSGNFGQLSDGISLTIYAFVYTWFWPRAIKLVTVTHVGKGMILEGQIRPRSKAAGPPVISDFLDSYIRPHSMTNSNKILIKLGERKIFTWSTVPHALAAIFDTNADPWSVCGS